MKFSLFILLIFSISVRAFANSETFEFMQKGIIANEKLYQFFLSHPCELGMQKNCERPLTARQITDFKEALAQLEEWRKLVFDGIQPMGDLSVTLPSSVVLGDEFKTELIGEETLEVTLANDDLSREFVQKARSSSATMVLLYDSFFRLAEVISKAKKLRVILADMEDHESDILTNTFSLVMDEDLWNATTYSVEFLEEVRKLGYNNVLSQEERFFEQFLVNSYVHSRMLLGDLDYRVRKAIFVSGQVSRNRFYETVYKLIGFVSKIFGNSAGLFQVRSGKLKKLARNEKVMAGIKKKLKPLDILLEKTPFRLTDHFIPGYFGHVAIWLGTADELDKYKVTHNGREMSILEHPDVLPHLEKLSQGKLVLEALRRPGVTLNTLENFMDIDDFVVIETPKLSDEETAYLLLRAFRQIGKPYDFNFDVETERSIVCSELVYTVFVNEVWPTEVTMGRYTISPDHVAWKAVKSCYKPKLMYLAGNEIQSNLSEELRNVLLSNGAVEETLSSQCTPPSEGRPLIEAANLASQ